MRTIGSKALAGLLTLLAATAAFAFEVDDTVPEATDRVARISFIRGAVQIRRDGSDDWEKADLNLPVVEGDEIATEAGARVEIQFNKDAHVRIAENSLLQVRQLSDSGIALSISRGVANLRVRKFDPDKEFFELDAPSTTVAVQREGSYRIDAGGADEREIRVSVTEGGEARVYSTNSGFALKSGRSAKIHIEGPLAGEWETADADRFADEFDAWSLDRNSIIEKALAKAHYDKYYDRDIYGAEELNDHGDWEYTRDYGYVWRPYNASISGYRDWSPYRYGSWRWVPPFGWTWVNDEPWGWATYHHGRWIWYHGRWVWTPYGYYRSNRSWWYPALVVVRVINRNICWYPLGYGHRYYNYNGYHDWVGNRRRGGDRDRDHNRDRYPRPGINPTPTPAPIAGQRPPRVPMPIEWENQTPGGRVERKPVDTVVPPSGVILISPESFGVSRKIGSTAPPELAVSALKKIDNAQLPPELPKYQAVRTKIGRDITTSPPEIAKRNNAAIRIGASDRQTDVPLDQELRRSRMFGNRQPVATPVTPEVSVQPDTQSVPRRTGAVTRPPNPRREIETTPIERGGQPSTETPPVVKENPRVEVPRRDVPKPREEPPRRDPPKPRDEGPRQEPPRRDTPPPKQESPKYEPPPRRDPPAPRQEAPRNDPPPRRESPPPKSDPPPKNDQPSPKTDAPSRKRDPIT